ncbi:hydrolase [candidate division KSB1 bacterium]|nr:MAG: hydrolase [candidate division KSB1 bacterium]
MSYIEKGTPMSNKINSYCVLGTASPGDNITSYFVIRKSEMKSRKHGTSYLHLELGDASGRITANLWDSNDYDLFKPGTIVKVQGTVQTYNSVNQLAIRKIRKCTEEDSVKPSMFIPTKQIDIDSLTAQLKKKISSVKNSHLQALLNSVFDNEDILNRFIEMAGGKLWHHAYVGGLIEHTMSVVSICETMAEKYTLADRDLLITGALLHDIGKIFEYGFDKGFIDFTDYGRLVGHISIGAHFIANKIEQMENNSSFPEKLKHQVMHLILSHQGKLEHGSPVLPSTIEAIILYYADEMDSKANAITHIIERDSMYNRNWSQYITILDRFIYLPELSANTEIKIDQEENKINNKISEQKDNIPGTLFDFE